MKPEYVYVASSWRCAYHPAVITTLKAASIPHYDFRNPPNNAGFGWEEVAIPDPCNDPETYLQGLKHHRAVEGFDSDFTALQKADTVILVLPCNRSAHLELGYAVGQGKRTAVLLTERPVVPELMYLMCDYIAPSLFDLLGWLGVED
jgi:hypothetical protein